MTLYEVRKRLKDIREHKGDPECAHGLEDQLFVDVLTTIASGTCRNPIAFAELALRSQSYKFPRWYS